MTDVPDVPVKSPERSIAERISIVWLIPFAALLIALGIAWQNYIDRGPLLTLEFESAGGVRADETVMKFRDVDVGVVESVSFSEALDRVQVDVRVSNEIAPFIDEEARFWIVSPQITTQGISGLDTVLSGVFIEGVWDSVPGGFVRIHDGLTAAPLRQAGEQGLEFVLRTRAGAGLSAGTPIIFKGIQVGRLGTPRLTEDGEAAETEAIIFAPYDQLITDATRFWDVSGFSFNLGTGGAELKFGSLATLISGGVSFETIVSDGAAVQNGTVFTLYSDEAAARSSVFSNARGPELQLAAIFADNVSGLAAGAPVELGGVEIGEVTNLTGIVDSARFGDRQVRLLARMSIRPSQLGIAGTIGPEEALDFLTEQVEEGLRARLVSGSLLTGGLKVEFFDLEGAAFATIDEDADAFPLVPTAPAQISDISSAAGQVLEKIQEIPFEALITSAVAFLENASDLVGNEDLNALPGEAVGLVQDVRGVVGSEAIQRVPEEIEALVGDIRSAAADLAALAQRFEEAGAVDRLLAAIEQAGNAAESAEETLALAPAMVEEITALAAEARALPLTDLVEEATALARSGADLIGSEGIQAIPAAVEAALEDVGTAADGVASFVATLEEAGTADRLVEAIDAAAAAAREAETALQAAPGLLAEIEALAAKANALPLSDLVGEATALARSGATLLGSEETRAVPAAVSAALEDVGSAAEGVAEIIARLTEAGAADRLVAALDAAAAAAEDARTALSGAPELVAEVQALAAEARELPLDELVRQATGLAAAARGIAEADGATELPASLNGALAEIEGLVAELRAEDGAARLVAAIAEVEAAAAGVGESVAGVPALVERLNTIADSAASVPLDRLAEQAGGALEGLRDILAAEGADEVPAALSGALAEVEATLAELRAGGTVENINATLASAERAADAIRRAADQLPDLVARINGLIAQAETTFASIDDDSPLNREARAALREIERAASAVTSLSRTIERQPNSLLLGR